MRCSRAFTRRASPARCSEACAAIAARSSTPRSSASARKAAACSCTSCRRAGIGLGNKVAAYQLQDEGKDTVEANEALGFEADLRSYDIAAGILQDLGVASVRLMTNNPEKIAGLEKAGMKVSAKESHWVGSTEHSAGYLSTKKAKLGHLS